MSNSDKTSVEVEAMIAEALRLDAEATPGPWGYKAGALKHYAFSQDAREDFGVSLQELHCEDGHEVPAAANAQLIARYRTLAPDLARELQRMRAMLRHAVASMARFTAHTLVSKGIPTGGHVEQAWASDAPFLGIGIESPERDEMWIVYRTAFEAEAK